ncbi:hypothetical protein NEAUS06_1630 [Nematocida ausubeli]|nr:hypothetical protein NEAUS06_1630 [Nematocida ausubeli]
MEEKHISTGLIKKTVKELLEIVEQADKFPKESLCIQRFFMEHRNKIFDLGKLVAVQAGMQPDSLEAIKFGKLLVFNYICSNVVSIQFLHQILSDEAFKVHVFRSQICSFVKELMEYAKKDKSDFLACMKREKKVLKQLKNSEKAAKNDPEWTKEIEDLEKRIRNISILIKDKSPNKPQEKVVPEKQPRRKSQFLESLEILTHFTCFCGFKRHRRPSKYAILRELTINMIETERVSYISVMPFLCMDRQKINIEMCSPNRVDSDMAKAVEKYIKYILVQFSKYVETDTVLLIKKANRDYKKTGCYNKERLRDIFLRISPIRKESILKAVNSITDSFFYINIIRVIYLLIHDFAQSYLHRQKEVQKKDIPTILLSENKIYHRALIQKYYKNNTSKESMSGHMVKMPAKKIHRLDVLLQESPEIFNLRNRKSFDNKFYLARAISDGIFTESGALSGYFRKYHALRVSILQSVLSILTRRIAEAVRKEIYAKGESTRDEKCLSREGTKQIHSIVKRRILSTLNILAIRFLKTKSIKPRTFIYNISPSEFEKRGLFGHYNELCMFLLLAVPIFAYSANILQ